MGGPLRFIHVPGRTSSSATSRYFASAAKADRNRTLRSRAPRLSHSPETTMVPMLCRVAAYRSPGLPSPATSQGPAKPWP